MARLKRHDIQLQLSAAQREYSSEFAIDSMLLKEIRQSGPEGLTVEQARRVTQAGVLKLFADVNGEWVQAIEMPIAGIPLRGIDEKMYSGPKLGDPKDEEGEEEYTEAEIEELRKDPARWIDPWYEVMGAPLLHGKVKVTLTMIDGAAVPYEGDDADPDTEPPKVFKWEEFEGQMNWTLELLGAEA